MIKQGSHPDPPSAGTSSASTRRDTGHQPTAGALPAHDSFRHNAFLWRGEDEFIAGTVPFIREGRQAGQPVMVAVTAPHIKLLRAALGTDAEQGPFVDNGHPGP